jgi:malate permease and related proteins
MNFLLIAICLISGYSLRTTGIIPSNGYKSINAWILYVAFPAVALHYVPSIQWNLKLLLPLSVPIIIWFGAWITLRLCTSPFQLDAKTSGVLLLTAGIANTSFIGFPLTQAYFGNEGLRVAIICDQMTFVMLSTFGVMSAMHCANSGRADLRKMLIGLIKFPPFVATAAALILPKFISLAAVDPLLQNLSATLIPLALFSVGIQLQFSEWKNEIKFLVLGLGYKLFIAPAIILGIAFISGIRGIVAQTSVFEAAMAPSITAVIIAGQYELRPRLATLMASLGIILSFLTTFLWWLLLRFFN